ncbi:MAG: FAD:protein FMN transferase [bacterium]|nr:FAD:protein FMN transferase [bacterium]
MLSKELVLRRSENCWKAEFSAMASPCELLIDTDTESEARFLASLALSETLRIESKFSRYRDDNIIHAINHSNGQPVELDDETSRMLAYANSCFQLSDGLFDITSGVLRKAWKFDGQPIHPDKELIRSLLAVVGWSKVALTDRSITLLPGMQIDLGGIGKEYAVDRAANLLHEKSGRSVMVNFGGDIRAIVSDSGREPWTVGIEKPENEEKVAGVIELRNGAIATSGDSRRFCLYKGKRLGHILDPRTGWPVKHAPRSVTVIAGQCTESGLLATLAMLHGAKAEEFLQAQEVTFHCIR